MGITANRIEFIYRVLSGDDADERACSAIPESACTSLPENYTLNVANGAATKLAEQLAGPNLVLPWLLGASGVPASLIGLLMPLKQVCSLAPQLVVSGQIRRVPRRKWVWVTAGCLQSLCLLLIALAVAALSPLVAGVAVLVLFALFSVASGAASVAFQDIAAKTIPKGRRGAMLSNRALLGGVLTIAAGGVIHFWLGAGAGPGDYLWLVYTAAALWLLAALLFARIREHNGATAGGRNPVRELHEGFGLLRKTPGFRRFLRTRGLLLSVELAMPFYALHAQSLFGGSGMAIGVFVVMVGIGNVVSSPVWGGLADRSSRRVMMYAGLVATAAAVMALGVDGLPGGWQSPYAYGVVFVLLGVAEQGVRLGRKTYLVDGSPSSERVLYVAFSNTLVGGLALAGALLGLVAQAAGPSVAIVLLGCLGVASVLAGVRTPEAERMQRASS